MKNPTHLLLATNNSQTCVVVPLTKSAADTYRHLYVVVTHIAPMMSVEGEPFVGIKDREATALPTALLSPELHDAIDKFHVVYLHCEDGGVPISGIPGESTVFVNVDAQGYFKWSVQSRGIPFRGLGSHTAVQTVMSREYKFRVDDTWLRCSDARGWAVYMESDTSDAVPIEMFEEKT